MPIVLDTHAWVWWVTADRRLSRAAARAIRNVVSKEGVSISAISIWEVAKKFEKNQLVLDRPLRQWLDQAMSVPRLQVLELTPAILIDSCDLPQPFHGDPADQVIAATARQHGATLVTKDRNLRQYPHLQTLW